jgi:hypothetical protein
MAVDAVLWFILAGMIAFLGYGCVRTARHSANLKKYVLLLTAYAFRTYAFKESVALS